MTTHKDNPRVAHSWAEESTPITEVLEAVEGAF